MTKNLVLFLILIIGLFSCVPSRAEESKLFSVNSEDLDPAESLNRVAGKYDAGRLSKDYIYKSKSHRSSDPLRGSSYEEVTY